MTYLWNPSKIAWLKGVIEQIHVFHLLFAFLQIGWRSHVMSSYVSEGRHNTKLWKKIGVVLLSIQSRWHERYFLVSKKWHLADDMSSMLFSICFTTLMSHEPSIMMLCFVRCKYQVYLVHNMYNILPWWFTPWLELCHVRLQESLWIVDCKWIGFPIPDSSTYVYVCIYTYVYTWRSKLAVHITYTWSIISTVWLHIDVPSGTSSSSMCHCHVCLQGSTTMVETIPSMTMYSKS